MTPFFIFIVIDGLTRMMRQATNTKKN